MLNGVLSVRVHMPDDCMQCVQHDSGELHTADIQTKAITLLSLQLSLQLTSVTKAMTPLMHKPVRAHSTA